MNSISPQMLGLSGPVTLLKATGDENQRGTALKRLVRLAVRWRWVLIGCVLAGALAGLVATLLMTRQYASTVRLQIARETAQVVNVGSVSRDVSIGDQEFYQTQYGLLRAQSLAERVARDIGVVDDPAFFRMFNKQDDFAGNPGSAGRARRNEVAGRVLLDHLEVAPVHGSSLVDIQAQTPSPALSQRIAETWGLDFIAANLERRQAPSLYARQFLEARLEQLRGRLEASELKAADYATANGLIQLPTTGNPPKSSTIDVGQSRMLVTDDLAALNAQRDAATAESIAAQSRLTAVGAQPDATTDALTNRAIGLLREDRADAAADYARLMAGPTPDDAAVKAARAKVETLDAAIKTEESRIRTSLQQAYQSASGRQKALGQQVDALKGSLAQLRQRSIQYNLYQRDADTNRELYDALLQRYKEVGVAAEALNNNVAVVDAARLPDRPSSPRLSLNLLLFTLAGAILGVLVAALLDQFDDRNPEPALAATALSEP
jgi:uncharacterized protein involved in exopolysaccharide biosynthesis